MSKEYEVVRFHESKNPRVIKRGLTREEAQRICNDPQTSSLTAYAPLGCTIANGKRKGMTNQAKVMRWHDQQKHWFYGFREERI